MVGYVMAVWGLCTMASSGLLGYAARFTGRRFLFAVGFLVDAAILLVLLWWSPHSDSGAVLVVLAVVMGQTDAIISVQTQGRSVVIISVGVGKEGRGGGGGAGVEGGCFCLYALCYFSLLCSDQGRGGGGGG